MLLMLAPVKIRLTLSEMPLTEMPQKFGRWFFQFGFTCDTVYES